jgi:hypothetical protein
VLYLAMHGVPFETAASLSATQRFAWVVAVGQLKGRAFDWDSLSWRE